MKRFAILTTIIATFATSATAQRDFSNVEIKTTEVSPGVYMLEGAGGNIGLSVGDDGAFLIDDQFEALNEKITAAIGKLTDEPIKFVLNTHYHGDHTGGNVPLANAGADIVAHDNVRSRLLAGIGDEDGTAKLPVITFSDTATFHHNGHEIHIFHPANAHTDGDAIVVFRDINVIHMGDVFFAGRFPYIDVDAGGNLNGYIGGLQAAAAIADDETKIIPGHGPLSSKADLLASIAVLEDIRNRIQALIDDGLSEDDVVAAEPLSDLADEWGWRFINAERMTQSAYRSLATD